MEPEIIAGDENHIPLLPWLAVLLSPVTAALTLLIIPDMVIVMEFQSWKTFCVGGIKKAILELN